MDNVIIIGTVKYCHFFHHSVMPSQNQSVTNILKKNDFVITQVLLFSNFCAFAKKLVLMREFILIYQINEELKYKILRCIPDVQIYSKY